MSEQHFDHYAVMGNPVAHSISPIIHEAFAKQFNDQISYEKILAPLDGFQQAVRAFQQQGGKGLNITLPFKEEAFRMVDELSSRAKLAQAVNTILFRSDGSLYGDNTDGVGLIRDLTQNQNIVLANQKILILGAGGAVRGILGPLLQQQPQSLCIANRSADKAQQLAEEFAALGLIQGTSLTAIPEQDFDLIINGTSLSLQEAELPFPGCIIHAQSICYDLAYSKTGCTRFQTWAQQLGAKASLAGLGMLVEQAAESYFIWRGKKPLTGKILSQLSAVL